MQKTQTESSTSKLVQELVTFPGYAAVLIGWLSVAGFLVWWLAGFFINDHAVQQSPVLEVVVVEPARQLDVVTVILFVLILTIILAVTWVYVAHWTKAALLKIAGTLRIKSEQYWVFCTATLLAGWVIAAGLLYAASGDKYASEFLFLSAAAITGGALSFGLAAIKGLTGLQADTKFSFRFSAAQVRIPTSNKKPKHKKS